MVVQSSVTIYGRCNKSTGDFSSTGIQRFAVKQQLNKHYSQLLLNTYVCMHACMYVHISHTTCGFVVFLELTFCCIVIII